MCVRLVWMSVMLRDTKQQKKKKRYQAAGVFLSSLRGHYRSSLAAVGSVNHSEVTEWDAIGQTKTHTQQSTTTTTNNLASLRNAKKTSRFIIILNICEAVVQSHSVGQFEKFADSALETAAKNQEGTKNIYFYERHFSLTVITCFNTIFI